MIRIPLPELALDLRDPEHLDLVTTRLPQALREAAFLGAEAVRGMWIQRARDMGVWRTGAYVRGLQADGAIRLVSDNTADPNATRLEVVLDIVATAPHSRWVEVGRSAFSLPRAMSWSSPRVKQGKNGPYLHVAFRHYAYVDPSEWADRGVSPAAKRAMMPREVYSQAKRLTRTLRRNLGPITSGGQFIQADRYTWGGRLDRRHITANLPGGVIEVRGRRVVGPGLINPAWKTSKFHGLFKSGPKGHTRYMTIRTITPRSAGFNIPAMTGKHIARQVATIAPRHVGPLVTRSFQAVFQGAP